MAALPPGQTRMECDGTPNGNWDEPESSRYFGSQDKKAGLPTNAKYAIYIGDLDYLQNSVILPYDLMLDLES
jgi:hypothetical protein